MTLELTIKFLHQILTNKKSIDHNWWIQITKPELIFSFPATTSRLFTWFMLVIFWTVIMLIISTKCSRKAPPADILSFPYAGERITSFIFNYTKRCVCVWMSMGTVVNAKHLRSGPNIIFFLFKPCFSLNFINSPPHT